MISRSPRILTLAAMLALPASAGFAAQPQQEPPAADISATYTPAEPAELTAGPDLKGTITARNGNAIKVTAADGTSTIVAVNETTRIRNGGLFGGSRNKLTADSLLNGLPVTVKTLQSGDGLLASRVTFRSGDMKTAMMIRNGTDQRFAEQTAATEALRGRMADIDQYNVKSTTNVNFDTGKAQLTPEAKANLCNAATEAQQTNNALILVVGYTDSTGSQEFNQTLSEKRASGVVNYLQQACGWKPYRMLTPTGMAEADPAADNTTVEGKAQNRRVAVNVLVSKAVDGF
jgi:outer membrane protein OmpA-like peptidoglycan-associated protein